MPQYVFVFAVFLIALTGVGFIRLILAIDSQIAEADQARALASEVSISK